MKKNYDHMLSRFHLIPERYGQMDGRTHGRLTDMLYQYRASVCWRAIKTVRSAEYTCLSQLCNSANSAAILRMEIKHVAAYYFLRTIMWRVDLREFVRQSSRNVALRVEQPSVLNMFFSELQYSAAFGRESRKFAGGVWKYAKFRYFLAHPVVLGWPGKNPSSNFSNDTQDPPRVKLSWTSVNQGRRIRRP